MRKLTLTLSFLLLSLMSIKAFGQQTYKNAIGGRFGTANGVTFKTFIGDTQAIDLILNFRSNSNRSSAYLTGLYEVHNPLGDVPGLQWYYGAGATIGSTKYKPTDDRDLYLAADGVIGLDYVFSDVPINLSLDWKPALELTPNTGLNAEGVGLSIRFRF